MKKISISMFLVLQCTLLLAQEQLLPWKHKKRVENVYSTRLNEAQSLHVVDYRDLITSYYGIIPFVTDSQGQTTEFDAFVCQGTPQVLSSQLEENAKQVLLLLADEKRGKRSFKLLGYDLNTGKQTFDKPLFTTADNVIVMRDEADKITVLKRNKLNMQLYSFDAANIDSVKIRLKHVDEWHTIFKNGIQWINQSEYVNHGSIYPANVYLKDKNIYFIKSEEATIKMITMNAEAPLEQDYRVFELPKLKKPTDRYTYLYKNKLFAFYHDKADIKIVIFDVEKGEKLHTYSLAEDFKYQLNHNLLTALTKKIKSPTNFLTAAINEGINGQLVIHFSYVKAEDYKYEGDKNFNYYHNIWFDNIFWQNQFHQQQINESIRNFKGFGPNVEAIDMQLLNSTAMLAPSIKKEKLIGFDVVLESDLSILNVPNTETVYKNTEAHEKVQWMHTNKKIKRFSAVAVGEEVHYFFYDKKGKTFTMGRSAFTK